MAEATPWRLLGIGGAASLCYIGGSAVGGPAVGGPAVGGPAVGGAALTTEAVAGGVGAGVAQVLVTVLTVGALGLAWMRFGPELQCERD